MIDCVIAVSVLVSQSLALGLLRLITNHSHLLHSWSEAGFRLHSLRVQPVDLTASQDAVCRIARPACRASRTLTQTATVCKSDVVTHTGQSFDEEDPRNVRFLGGKSKEVRCVVRAPPTHWTACGCAYPWIVPGTAPFLLQGK